MSPKSFDVKSQLDLPLALTVLSALWAQAGLDPGALSRIGMCGREPGLRTSMAIGSALQAALGAAALAASEVLRLRTAIESVVELDLVDVLREAACRFTVDGRAPPVWDKLSGLYRCSDPGASSLDGDTLPWVRIHTNFAHHRDGTLALLGVPASPGAERAAVEAALSFWSAHAFEDAAAACGIPAAAMRSPSQWAAHPQAAALALEPLLGLSRFGDAAMLGWPVVPPRRPLSGIRVLELTRVLAGPVAGRTLAAQGADVLLVNAPDLPNIEALAETSRGKRSALLDLCSVAGRETLRALIAECDIFLQSYRPGALAALGFGPEELERLRPGLVTVSLSAYGSRGPWAERRGFDSLVQAAIGINIAEAEAFGQAEPRSLPLPALDYGAGYLLAFGAITALMRQRMQGGSWRVHVSLAGVGHWLLSLGRLDIDADIPKLDFDDAFEETDSGFGRLRAVRHAVRLAGQRLDWSLPSVPPGTHEPVWPERA